MFYTVILWAVHCGNKQNFCCNKNFVSVSQSVSKDMSQVTNSSLRNLTTLFKQMVVRRTKLQGKVTSLSFTNLNMPNWCCYQTVVSEGNNDDS